MRYSKPLSWLALIFVFLSAAATPSVAQLQHFIPSIDRTGSDATVFIPLSANPNINGTPLQSGDEIGVFSPEGLLVGSVVWTGVSGSITIWGDNSQTSAVDGLKVGDVFSFRVWDQSANAEYASVSVTYDAAYRTDGAYANNSIYALTSLIVTPPKDPDPVSAVLYRVDAGGPELSTTDSGPNWSTDTGASPSPYTNAYESGSAISITTNPIALTASVPSGTPMALFQTERYDPYVKYEMQWNFPVTSGEEYEVHLFFAETYFTESGKRVFDVVIEGQTVLSNYDQFVDAGGKDRGVMKKFTTTVSDGQLTINFPRKTNNPSIKGIEIISLNSSGSANTAPVLATIGDQTAQEGSSITVPLSANDPEGNKITFSATGVPAFGNLTDNGDGTASLVFTPPSGSAGMYSITVTASDGSLTDSETFTLTVSPPPNTAPVLAAIGNQSVEEGSSLTVSVNASDPEGNPITFSTSNLPSFGNLTDNGNGTGSLVFNAPASSAGSYSITVTVSDGKLTDSETFTLTVTSPPPAGSVLFRVDAGGPQLSASSGPNWSADTGTAPSPYTNASASGSITSSTSATITLTSSVPSGTPMALFQTERYDPSSGSEMQWNFPVTSGKQYEVRLYFAETYFTASGQRTFDLAIEGQTVLSDYDQYVDAGGKDRGVMKKFTTTVSDGQVTIDFRRRTNNPSIRGIEIVSTDGAVNTAPVLATIGNQSVQEGSSLTVPISASDAEGNKITFSATGIPAFGKLTDNGDGTGTLAFTPPSASVGNYSVTVTASDGFLSDSETFTLTVSPPANTAPVLASIGNKSVQEGGSLTVAISATDAEGNTITFSVTNLPSFGKFTDNKNGTGSLVFNPTAGNAGSYSITVTASDGSLNDSETFTLTVNPPANTAPVLASIGNQTVEEGKSLTVALSATDPEGNSISFSVTNIPTFATLTDNKNGTANLTFSPSSGSAGTYSMTVTVSDGKLTDSETFTLTVTSPVQTAVVLFRVDAGGPQLSASSGPAWGADANNAPSKYANASAANSKTQSTTNAITLTSSVPSGVPMALFQTMRYDLPAKSEMQWNFPVTSGKQYEVRLYFAEIEYSASGQRTFDVLVEGQAALTNFDPFTDAGGAFKGVMKKYTTTVTDGQLTIDFRRRVQNPAVSGIEILSLETSSTMGAIGGPVVQEGTSPDGQTTAADSENASEMPVEGALYQNYPNPFNPTTSIPFDLPQSESVRVSVYDLLGREVAILVDGNLSAGKHSVTWDASGFSSGVYLIRMTTAGQQYVRTVLLQK